MEGCSGLPAGSGYQWLGAGEERLDRALVSGLMLDAALAGSVLSADPQARGRMLKTRVQEALLTHLAGRITLDRFRTLIGILDRSFAFYLPLISAILVQPGERPEAPPAPAAATEVFPSSPAVHPDLLAASLDRLPDVLPRRPHSKLTREKWLDFLGRTRGRWFRLRDLESHFSVDRKTAWEYVQKFLSAGLLSHNSGRAAAVRYGLADKFLRVQGQAVRQHTAASLAGLSSRLAVQVADWLIASGGEPFWEEEWGHHLGEGQVREILKRLTAPASLLEAVSCPDGPNRLVRLRSRWLQPEDGDRG